MSGIVGIINMDGQPVDATLLRHMTDYMAYRGPDAQEIWIDGSVGFGHTMLRTTFESEKEHQPCTLDGRVWITADARIDAREELTAKLIAKGFTQLEDPTDPELILHAYNAWGQECANHLLGDFAFAIWDGRERRLFCARDHFGVKPFYYARVADSLLFSNTLNCLRTHPAVSDELNDLAIADFLMFGFNISMDNSSFEDIKRLPPAHTLVLQPDSRHCQIESYWSLPTPRIVRYKKQSEYVDHFREVFTAAIEDRLRTDRVMVSMSGGLDSTSITVIAHQQLSKRQQPFTLLAYTNVTKETPDLEEPYARLVAEYLNIPIVFNAVDDGDKNPFRNEDAASAPEPTGMPIVKNEKLEQIIANSSIRVMFTGFGGDPALYPSQLGPYEMLKRGYGARNLLIDHIQHIKLHHHTAPLYWRSTRNLASSGRFPRPPWIRSSLIDALKLEARWEVMANRILHPQLLTTSLRPRAYMDLSGPLWPNIFRLANPETTGRTIESAFPFFDVRLIELILALPPIPWCEDKEIVRAAMTGRMPEKVRTRPKTPLQIDPLRSVIRTISVDEAQTYITRAPELERFLDIDKYLRLFANVQRLKDNENEWISRPLSLAFWLTKSLKVSG